MPYHSRKKQGKEFDYVSLKVKNANFSRELAACCPKLIYPVRSTRHRSNKAQSKYYKNVLHKAFLDRRGCGGKWGKGKMADVTKMLK